MRKFGMFGVVAAASLSLGACATTDPYGYDPYGYDNRNSGQLGQAATGAAIGAAAGAGLGAVVGGVSPVEGAVAGAVAGGVIGAVSGNNQRWVRDTRGYCYYVDAQGRAVYDYNRRC